MAKLINKMLNFVGWETENDVIEDEQELSKEEQYQPAQYLHYASKKQQQSKVVNIHSSNQMKVVIMQPDDFEDARDICDHLKNKKPIIINLEGVGKEIAQRIIDFLSGSVYALDGDIQKISSEIFLIAPSNVDIMGEFKDELRDKGIFPWVK